MPTQVYILTDGKNTKIGITTQTLRKRLSAYHTHNASAQLIRTFNFPDDHTARRIEATVKAFFRPFLVGQGKEWFSVSPVEIIEMIVHLDHHISRNISNHITQVSFHNVPLSDNAYDAIYKIRDLQKQMETTSAPKKIFSEQIENFHNTVHREFSRNFKLGISEADLRSDSSILTVKIDSPAIDVKSIPKPNLSILRNVISRYQPYPPKTDHPRAFYEIAPLSSGEFVAICSGFVSMPYIETFSEKNWRELISEIHQYANELGWHCTEHHEWSWHFPGKTGLILFQPKTPIQQRLREFNTSLRKFVIEREKVLKFHHQPQPQVEYAIEDIIRDSSFPLHFDNFNDLYRNYIKPFWGVDWKKEDPMRKAHEHIFNAWKND